MVSVELSTRERDGQVVVVLRGALDVADAAKVAASLTVVAASGRNVIVDLKGLEFIDSSGLAALVRARLHARRAGCDLALAAPQQQVLRMLAITRLIDVFEVHACADEAADMAGRIPVARPEVGPEIAATPARVAVLQSSANRGRRGPADRPALLRTRLPAAARGLRQRQGRERAGAR
jgi:anti-sigma B factor antagonist